MIDKMEEKGIIGPPDQRTQIREVLPQEDNEK
jgi:DNA segregation ATPase FtsK/SpoIIIE-like protein